MRIVIRNGRLVCPAQQLDELGDLYIADGRIVAAGKAVDDFTADLEIALEGQFVCPGIVDLSVHTREPGFEHKATIASETEAAVRAGVTSMVCPPNTRPVTDNPSVVELIHQRQARLDKTHIYPLGALTKDLEGRQLTEVAALRQAGCVGLSNADNPITDTEVLRRAFEYAVGFDLPVFIHPEDSYLRNRGVMHEGKISTRLGLPGIPETAETIAISRALLLIEQTGVRAHFCRLSCARSVELVAAAKQQGLPVSADAGICYLYLTEMNVDGFNSQCHLWPPLRADRDRQALLDGLRSGIIDAVCSDHQPHDEDAKAAPFSSTEPGASTLEVLAPLVFNLASTRGFKLEQIVGALTCRPASIIGINAGTLAERAPADLFIFDEGSQWTVNAEILASAGKNTPFDNWEMGGKVTCTIIDGKVMFRDL
ncbi:MAG: dihydroorotase [Gammaproteobacteria bacterium]|nr:dihydroorotase [Gammaproteobacteria bacterium]